MCLPFDGEWFCCWGIVFETAEGLLTSILPKVSSFTNKLD